MPGFSWHGDRLIVALPRAFFDGRSHRLSLTGKATTETFEHRSVYEAALSCIFDASGERLSGSIRDTTRPGVAILLDVDLDGDTAATLTADARTENGAHGFNIANPAAQTGRGYCPCAYAAPITIRSASS
ncbi:MAG: hypothetical protein WDN06_15220 [Asticcacaulis sp.]